MNFQKISDWKVVRMVLDLLKQGMTPEKIALCVALGVSIGIFPVLGTTTALCTAVVFIFKVNFPLIQLVNYLVYPLQLILILPFIRCGETLFRTEPIPLSVPRMLEMFKNDFFGAIQSLWVVTLHAVAVWLIAGPLLAAALYFVIKPLITRLKGSR